MEKLKALGMPVNCIRKLSIFWEWGKKSERKGSRNPGSASFKELAMADLIQLSTGQVRVVISPSPLEKCDHVSNLDSPGAIPERSYYG